MVKRVVIALVVMILMAVQSVAAIPSPTEQLQVSVDRIIELLRDKERPRDEVLQELTGLVRRKFDFVAMSQSVLGVNWRHASREQQQRFVRLFSQLLEDTYRGRVAAYTYEDEYVEYVGERILGSRAEVQTVIVADKNIPVAYRMRLRGDEWLVFDVIIEEVSLVSNYRSSYAQIIRNEGFEGLLSRMEERLRELAEKDGTKPAEREVL